MFVTSIDYNEQSVSWISTWLKIISCTNSKKVKQTETRDEKPTGLLFRERGDKKRADPSYKGTAWFLYKIILPHSSTPAVVAPKADKGGRTSSKAENPNKRAYRLYTSW